MRPCLIRPNRRVSRENADPLHEASLMKPLMKNPGDRLGRRGNHVLDSARPVLRALGPPSRCSPAYRCACRSPAYGGLPMRDSGPPVPKSFAGPPHNQRFPKGASDSSSGPSPCLPASPRNAGCTRRRCPYCPPSPGATPCGRHPPRSPRSCPGARRPW